MDKNGCVLTASEFKVLYADTGQSNGPYCCPFCEVPYEDKCITTECVKAPHFKLPNGTTHNHSCDGEGYSEVRVSVKMVSTKPKKKVVGGIEVPEALILRRKPIVLRREGDDGRAAKPDADEVIRRRKLIPGGETISSLYTTSLLRAIIEAYKRLKKHIGAQAKENNLEKDSKEFTEFFRDALCKFPLMLYGQKFTYGNAFRGRKIAPMGKVAVYFGSGVIRLEGDRLVIRDNNSRPIEFNSNDLIPFDVELCATLPVGSPTSHVQAMLELTRLAGNKATIEWYGYGQPSVQDRKHLLSIASLDHFYWQGQFRR